MTTEQLVAYQSNDGQPMADSLTVAEKFGKRHDDVLKALRNLDCSDKFRDRNFAASEYQVETGLGHMRSYPMYLMTRDGFVFLVMGFEGKRAAHWKETYIHAFNAMEGKLKLLKFEEVKL